MSNLPGSGFREEAADAVSYLASLFSVCSFALADVKNWNDSVRNRAVSDIKAVLDLGAILADETTILVERRISEPARREARDE
jgi:pyruvate-formate lyase-activating enzyme